MNPAIISLKKYLWNIYQVLLKPDKVNVVSKYEDQPGSSLFLSGPQLFWKNETPEDNSGNQKLPVSVVLTTIKSRSYFTNEFVIPALQQNNPAEILIIDDEDLNVQEKRNKGAAMATQDFIIFCDDDKIMPKHYLSILYKSLLNKPEYGFAYTDYQSIIIDAKGHLRKTNFYHQANVFDIEELRKMNYIDTCSLMRREAFCGFDPAIKRLQDWDLWLTMSEKGIKGLYVRNTGFLAFYLDEGISSNSNSYIEALASVKAKHGISLD
jgi:hypothetical protein